MAANTSWPESLLQPLPLNDKPSVRSHNAQQVCMEVQVFRVLMTIHLNEKFEVLTANKHLWSDITILMDHMASVYLHVYSSELLPWSLFQVSRDRRDALGSQGTFGWEVQLRAAHPTQASPLLYLRRCFLKKFPSFPAQDQNLSPKVCVAGNKLCKIPRDLPARGTVAIVEVSVSFTKIPSTR